MGNGKWEMGDEHVTSEVHLAARRTGSILLRKRERAFPYEQNSVSKTGTTCG